MKVEYNTGNIKKYESKNPLKRTMVKRFNKRIIGIIKELDGEKTFRILDAGCGEGYIDRLILDEIDNVQIVGLEYTEEAIEIAKSVNPQTEYINGDICQIPFEDDSFDYVICTEVLEHLSEPKKALEELIRVSKGKLLITVPHEPWFCMGNMLALKNITRFGNPIDHINHWTKKSFLRFLNSIINGWEISGSFPWIVARLVSKE